MSAAVIALAMVGTSLTADFGNTGLFDEFFMTADAAETVTYIEYSWNGSALQTTEKESTNYTVVTKDLVINSSGGTGKGLLSGTYVVKSNTTVEDYIYIRKGTTVNFIVKDGATLTCKKGIGCGYDKNNEAARLNIYGGGTIVTTGENKAAGIGGRDDESNGWITIHGTTVKATGGNHAAGIGGGEGGKDPNATSPTITIYDGNITATGGTYGAGIGGGDEQPGARTYIYGGTVTASSTKHGAGIGGGDEEGTYGVHIYGGTVTATGGEHGAGIGAGEEGGNLRKKADGGGVNIYGGTVTATGGKNAAGIGGGYNEDMSGEINISGESTKLTATGVDGAAGIGAGRAERGTFVTDTGDMGGTITINCGKSSELKICGGDNHVNDDSYNSRGGAGIGAGFAGNLYGKVYINGGNLDITSGYNGAGIGGGAEDGAYGGEGGDVYVGGGRILIHLLYDHVDGKSSEAIGAGHADSKSGSLYISESENKTGKHMRVSYKSYNNEEDFQTVSSGDRSKKCHTRSTILIDECEHCAYDGTVGLSYTITPNQHVGKCKYCKLEDTGPHESELYCYCGYKNGNVHSIIITTQFGSPVQTDIEMNYVASGKKYLIPECDKIPKGMRFIGWALNGDTTLKNLRRPGETITINDDTTLDAQYADLYHILKNTSVPNGWIDASKYSADAGEKITVSSVSDEGYKLKKVYIRKDNASGTVLIEKNIDDGNTDFEFTMPSENIYIDAEFEAITHSVSIKAEHGTVTANKQVFAYDDKDRTVTLTVTPDKNYRLGNISCQKLGSDDDDEIELTKVDDTHYTFEMPDSDVRVTAEFESGSFTVTWKNADGTVLETDENVAYGTMPSYDGQTPSKPSTAQHSYTFSGWDKTPVAVTESVTYTATFTESVNKYKITWKSGSTVLKTDTVEYGTVPKYSGDTPTKSATAQYTYTFSGWDKTPVAATANATYTAKFTSTVNKYKITWKNGNTVLKTETLEYGTLPKYTGDDPTKADTAQYTFKFIGWSEEIVPVSENATYTAAYLATTREYSLTLPQNMSVVGQASDKYLYDTTVEFKVNSGYAVIGDVKNGSTVLIASSGVYSVTVTADTTITAITGKKVARVEPTCEEPGNILYYIGSDGKLYKNTSGSVVDTADVTIPAKGHTYGAASYTWSADKTSCTAKAVCTTDPSHILTETVKASYEVTKAPTTKIEGVGTYTATFTNPLFSTKTTTIKLEKENVIWNDPSYSWTKTSSGYTCTASRTAANDPTQDAQTETVTAEYRIMTPAGCETKGKGTYSAIFENKAFNTQTKSVEIAETGHSFSEWNVTKAATCTAAGSKTRTCSACGKTETKTITKLGHNYKDTVVKPTCEEKGYTQHKCSRCGDMYKDTYTDAAGHKFSDWNVTKAATCTAAGSQTRTCSVCGKTETKTVAKLGHNYKDTVVKPTCEEKGYTQHKCSRCGDMYKDTYTNAAGHQFSNWKETKAASCTETGIQTRKCSACGKTETNITEALGHKLTRTAANEATCTAAGNKEYWTCKTCGKYYVDKDAKVEIGKDVWVVEAKGHTYKDTVVAPTCTDEGYTEHTCTRCGDSYKDSYTDIVPHRWSEWRVTVEPTETTGGMKVRTCSVCERTMALDIPPTTHEHNYQITVVAPTCTEKGYTLHTCDCGDEYKDNFTDPEEHNWSKWSVTKQPTETSTGVKQRTCSVCKAKQSESIPVTSHEHSYMTIVIDPTCTEKGYTIHVCKCGDEYRDTETDKSGHNFSSWAVTKPATCLTAGTKTRDCAACGKTETETIAKLGHDYKTTVVDPTCTEEGYTLHRCSRCSDNYKDTYTKAAGHKFGSWSVTKQATCTADGTKTKECKVCGKTETATITKLGHNYKASVVDPTCTEKGYTIHRCSRCGDNYKDTYTKATGHKFSDWTVTKPANCTAAGTKTRECSACGKTETDNIAKLGHDYKTTVVDPTCTEKGYTIHRCSRCGNSYNDTYTKAAGHMWSEWKEIVKPTLTSEGKKERKCSVCGKTETQTIPKAKLTVERLAGTTRFTTAVEISKASYDKADTVILAYGLNYADALAGIPLAEKLKAPILLTATDKLSDETLAEIKRLGAKKAIIIGGKGVISEKVEKTLRSNKISTERIAGNNRFSTATAIAEKLSSKPTDVFFIYGLDFPDALSASTVAAIKGSPIIYLTTDGKLNPDTAAYLAKLKKAGSVKNAYVIGGTGVISDKMMKQAANALGLSKATRIAGANRFLTCVAVNEKFRSVLTGDMICVATGMDFPDALVGGAFAAKNKAPLLLINGKTKTPKLLDEQKKLLKTKQPQKITVFGGTGAVPEDHVKDLKQNIL